MPSSDAVLAAARGTARKIRSLVDIDVRGCELLILDFDGVVADLDIDWPALKAELAAYCAQELDLTVAFSPLGAGRDRVREARGEEALRAVDDIIEKSEIDAARRIAMSHDLARLLDGAYRGPIAICSSTSHRALTAALERLSLASRCAVIVGRDDVSRLKPSPEGLSRILEQTGCAPASSCFVGDRDVDAKAGEAVGIPTYLVDRVETRRLEVISARHSYDDGFNGRLTQYRAEKFAELVPEGGSLLDLGCAAGSLTRLVAERFDEVTVVDASASYLRVASERLGGAADCVHALIEDFETEKRFDCVLASGVLEHVEDPVAIARRAAGWLAPGGSAVFLVPNARAMHRRVGVALGLLGELTELCQHDHAVGHRRYYTRDTLRRDVTAAGLEVVLEDGIFLKPLSNAQINDWSPELADAFYELGRDLPDHCAELIVVCRTPG